MYRDIQKIHFVGIGGVGMSGLAEVLLNLGYQVSGSDLQRSPLTKRLHRRGARVYQGHQRSHVDSAQVVVVSSAIARSNPEMQEAYRLGIPVIARAEMLAELMRLKYGIAVAGSHGKTSTTSLVAAVLSEGGLDPTIVIGGRVRSLRSTARLGKGDFLVAEADESDGSFLHLSPTIAVVTNIDHEHMDHYRDFSALKKTFQEFSEKIPFYGCAILCTDHPVVRDLAGRFKKRLLTYGLHGNPDISARSIRPWGMGKQFTVTFRKKPLGAIRLRGLSGEHNVLNSLAAVAVAQELKIPFKKVQRALSRFQGIDRRFQVIKEKPVMIVDDYGHHPEEIRATLKAAREIWKKRKIWVLFQPHRYSRTHLLLNEFSKVFGSADHVLVTEIYAAGEKPIQGVSGSRLAKKIPRARFCPDRERMMNEVQKKIRPGDVLITLGAGDIWKVGRELAKKFALKNGRPH